MSRLIRLSVESITRVYGPEGGAVYQVELLAGSSQDARAVAAYLGGDLSVFPMPTPEERHETRAQLVRVAELAYGLGFDPEGYTLCDPRPESQRNPKLPKQLCVVLTVEDFDRVVMHGDGLLRRASDLHKGSESWVWFEYRDAGGPVRLQCFNVPPSTMDRWFHPEKYVDLTVSSPARGGDES